MLLKGRNIKVTAENRQILARYSGTTFRVIIKYWHDLFLGSNTGTTFFDGSDTGTTSAFSLRWHFLFFPPPPGCHLVLFILSLSSSHAVLLPLSSFSLSLAGGPDHRISHGVPDQPWMTARRRCGGEKGRGGSPRERESATRPRWEPLMCFSSTTLPRISPTSRANPRSVDGRGALVRSFTRYATW